MVTEGQLADYHHYQNLVSVIEHIFWLHKQGAVIYAMVGGQALVNATSSKLWVTHEWNGRVSYYEFCGKIKIYPMSSVSQDPDAVWPFFEWLGSLEIAPGSFTSIARRTWEKSLDNKTVFYDQGGHGRDALYGSRKEAIRGEYDNMYYQDLSAAFPTAMAYTEFPRMIRETDRKSIDGVGYALASINVPAGLDWNPIPCRLGKRAVVYGYGTQTDWWTFEDLRHVQRLGGLVYIHKAYRGHDARPVFLDWYEHIILPARANLSGDAQGAVKTIANRLWSSFAIGGTSKVSRFVDGRRRKLVVRTTEFDATKRSEAYIASQTLALVRSRVLEALYAVRDPVYVDTDGIICREREDLGDGWRIKKRMKTVSVRSCQNYKWECYRCGVYSDPQCGGPHYALALPAKDRRENEKTLRLEHMPVNPLFGITVQPDYDLKTLRGKWSYDEPVQFDSDSIPWDTLRERSQQRLGF